MQTQKLILLFSLQNFPQQNISSFLRSERIVFVTFFFNMFKGSRFFPFLPPWCVHLSELKCCMMTNLHYIFSNGWIWIICLEHHGLSAQSHSSTNNSRQWLWVEKEGLTPLQFIINHSFSAPTAPSLLLYVSSCKSHTHFQLSHFLIRLWQCNYSFICHKSPLLVKEDLYSKKYLHRHLQT